MRTHKLSKREYQNLISNWNHTGKLGKVCPKCGKVMYYLMGEEQYTCLTYECDNYLELVGEKVENITWKRRQHG